MTKIEWTHRPGTKGETWNPVVGRSVVSPGCTNCYAMRMAARLEAISSAHEAKHGGDPGPLHADFLIWLKPKGWFSATTGWTDIFEWWSEERCIIVRDFLIRQLVQAQAGVVP